MGTGLNEALRAIERRNDEELHGVTSHIDFNLTVGNVSLGDRRLRELIWHFSRYRLRNEDFEFPDMLGAAYEYLIDSSPISAARKAASFTRPAPVVRMMVPPRRAATRRVGIRPMLRLSGGMLILSREYVDEHGGDGTASLAALAGQELNGSVWAIAKMNMLLHGIRDADLRNGDTLGRPEACRGRQAPAVRQGHHQPAVLYRATIGRDRRHFASRMFVRLDARDTGKKADLMFVQHMLAVLRPTGMAATVMPHGVLFRGGAERDIRLGTARPTTASRR